MTRLTIPACEVREGDRLTGVGGVGVNGAYPYSNPERPGHTILYLGASVDDLLGSIALPDDALVEVERPDPDAELIERMAQAIHAADHTNGAWDEYTDDEREDYLALARAALAVVRADQ